MVKFVQNPGLTYNNIGIVPSIGKVRSRSEIEINSKRIIIAGMSSIIGEKFLDEWINMKDELRPSIHIPRDKNSLKFLEKIAKANLQDYVFVGVGLKTPNIEDVAIKFGYKQVLIDIAFGGLPQLGETIYRIREKYKRAGYLTDDLILCTGSISTEEQAAYLETLGVDIFRANVGSGSVCSTKFQSGVFMGPVTEILNLQKYKDTHSSTFAILGDGGIKHCGDFSKAFLLGCDYVQSGFCFTKCKNAQMHIDGSNLYYGESNKEKGLRAGKTKYDESLTKEISSKKLFTIEEIMVKIIGGVRSAISYAGFSSLKEAIGNGTFIKLETPLEFVDSWNI